MAIESMDLWTFVGKLLEEQDGNVLFEGIRVLAQALMGAEVAVAGPIGTAGSTNPLERQNKGIERRRLWSGAERRYFSAESMKQLTQPL